MATNDYIEETISLATYRFAKRFSDEGIFLRDLAVRPLFEIITKIDNGEQIVAPDLTPSDRATLRQLIQLDIISKIMVFTEDFGLFASAFVDDPKQLTSMLMADTATITWNFTKRIDSLADEDLRRLLAYPDPDEVLSNVEEREQLKEAIALNFTEVRRVLREMRAFRDQHIDMYRRYKHGGFGLMLGALEIPSQRRGLVVQMGKEPGKVVIIPYHNRAPDRLSILWASLRKLLLDIIHNNLLSVEDRSGSFFDGSDYSGTISPEKAARIQRVCYSLYSKRLNRPVNVRRFSDDLESTNSAWYDNIDEFLREANENPNRL